MSSSTLTKPYPIQLSPGDASAVKPLVEAVPISAEGKAFIGHEIVRLAMKAAETGDPAAINAYQNYDGSALEPADTGEATPAANIIDKNAHLKSSMHRIGFTELDAANPEINQLD